MDHGEIIERGDHESLMENVNPNYTHTNELD